MQFQNCAAFNKWNLADQLAFLRRALDNKATHVFSFVSVSFKTTDLEDFLFPLPHIFGHF